MKYVIRFLCIIAVLGLLSEGSFLFFRKRYEQDWEPPQVLTGLGPMSESIPRVSAGMDIVLECYNITEGKVMSEAPFWDERIAGMSGEELRSFLDDPYQLGTAQDFAGGYYASSLVSFDRESLRIRKLYQTGASFYPYIGYLRGSELYVFEPGAGKVLVHERINRGSLSYEQLRSLQEGVYLRSPQQLAGILAGL